MADPTKLGGKIGPRLADLTQRAMTAHLQASASTRAKIDLTSRLGVYRTITGETRTTVAPIFRELAEDPEMAAWLRDLMHFLGHGSGEFQAIVTSLVMGTAVSPSIGTLVNNELAPKIQNLIAKLPHALLDTNTAAGAVARGLWANQHGELEAARQGVSANRFETLVDLSYGFPDLGTGLELLRRGDVSRKTVGEWLRRTGMDPSAVNELLKLERVHLSPADAADMVLRGIITVERGHEVAKHHGLANADFDALVLDTGEPPGTQELLFAYRRGIINKARLEHGIRQARTRNEWIDVIESLRHVPMSTADAVRATVQNHLPLATAAKIAEQNGLQPEHFTPLVESYGRPPGMQQMLSLLNRGLTTEAKVKQAIRESDIKNKYIADLVELRRHLLPQRTVVSMLRHGALTDREAIDHLLNLGISHKDAAALVGEASAAKTAGHKDLAEGTILRLYEAHTITHQTAKDAILALGYSEHETGWVLAMADVRRVEAERNHAVTVIRGRYVAHHLDKNEASAALDTLRMPAAERDRLLPLWDLERAANARQLTEPQIVKAWKKSLIDQADATARLVRMGYSQEDAGLLLQMA